MRRGDRLNMSELDGMRAFWDQKAQDNPLWYVTTTLDYASPDERAFWESGAQEASRVLDDARVARGDAAAEIGCGIGRLTRALAARFKTVHAFDVSPKMVELARTNLRGIPGVTVSATAGDGTVPLADGSVDFVLSMQVFHHIPEPAITLRYIREAGRALRPGGAMGFQLRTCRFADPVTSRIERAARKAVAARRRRVAPPPTDLDAPAWHGSRVLRSQIRAAARAAGMRIESLRWLDKRGGNAQIILRKAGA